MTYKLNPKGVSIYFYNLPNQNDLGVVKNPRGKPRGIYSEQSGKSFKEIPLLKMFVGH
jgi:hypothetical protein